MRSKRSHEGYLLIDHRASPGTATIPEGGAYESATVTCSHCHRIVVLNPMRTRERGYCSKCDHYVCDSPGCNVGCNPLNKVFDEQQKRELRALARGIILP